MKKRQAPAALVEGRARRARGQRDEIAKLAQWVAIEMADSGIDETEAIALWCSRFEPEWFEGDDDVRRTAARAVMVSRRAVRLRRHRRRTAQNDMSRSDSTSQASETPHTDGRSGK